MDFFVLIIKSSFSFFVLFLLARILGKKQIEQLNIFDYVIGITIGNVAAEMSINEDISFLDGVIVMTVYTVISLFINLVSIKSIFFRRLFSSTPIVVMEKGKIIEENLKKIKFDVNDFLEEARINGYFNIDEIEYAIMEANGSISFLPKENSRPVKVSDLKESTLKTGLCANLVIDGNIMNKHLEYIKKDKKWLISSLNKMGFSDINNLLLVTCDVNNKLYVYEKNSPQKELDCLE